MTCHGKPIKVKGKVKNMTFEEVHEQFKPLLHNRTAKYRAHTLFDDIFQTARIALWDSYKRYKFPKSEFMTFAYQTIDYEILNFLRAYNRTYIKDPQVESLVSLDATVSSENDILIKDVIKSDFNLELDIEQKDNVQFILSNVTDNQRKILSLIAYGYNQSEIARKTGRSRQAVNNQLLRVRSKFRKEAQHA